MILSIIHLVMVSVLILAPAFLYKSRKRCMILFYQRMSYSEYCRMFYARILLLTLIMFHFSYYWMKPGSYGVMISTLLIVYLFSTRRTLSLLKDIRNSRGTLVFVFTLIMKGLPVAYVLISDITVTVVFCLTVGLIYFMTRSIVETASKAENKDGKEDKE